MEETGRKAFLNTLAGSYCYLKDGRPKIVLVWHITSQAEPYEKPASKEEVDQVVWLSPDEALRRLTHDTERELVARHSMKMFDGSVRASVSADPQIARLKAAFQSCRERFIGSIGRRRAETNAWWVDSVRRSLDLAEGALNRRDTSCGWGALHDAERFMVFGMNDTELVARACSLKAETHAKLKGWRVQATDSLFAPLKLVDWLQANGNLKNDDRILLQQAVLESLTVLNEHSDNVYHRMRLVGKQLNFLVTACAILLAGTFAASYFLVPSDSKFSLVHLGAVALSGALGGVVSAMYQLSRLGEAKIPEALLHGLVTSGRPLVGAASALFVYAVIQSNIISLIDASKVTLGAGLVLGFVAGFSEQFVLSTVAKVSASEKRELAVGGKLNPPKSRPGKKHESGGQT
jgi:hypothetical protein